MEQIFDRANQDILRDHTTAGTKQHLPLVFSFEVFQISYVTTATRSCLRHVINDMGSMMYTAAPG
jgi:hypothetical protein